MQATIERRHLYILGQSKSTVEDQMQFVPTRQEDLRELHTLVSTDSGIEIHDTMRFMNGDNPAVEMEDGTQHGRHFGCVGCDGNINRNYHLAYTFQRRHQTLLEKQDLVKSAPAGRKLGLHPFKNIKDK